MSESDGEIDDDVLSLKKINEHIYIETTAQPISNSPGESASKLLLTAEQRKRNECLS